MFGAACQLATAGQGRVTGGVLMCAAPLATKTPNKTRWWRRLHVIEQALGQYASSIINPACTDTAGGGMALIGHLPVTLRWHQPGCWL